MRNFYQQHPLAVIILAAFLLRSGAAFYNYTPNAEDDYANVIEPALKHYQTGESIKTEAYRLPLLPKIFYSFLAPLKLFGITDTTLLVSWGLFLLGLLSLFGVWAFFEIGKQIAPGWERQAGWLYAAHLILPFFSTRAFQESITLTTVPLGLYFLKKRESHLLDYLLAGVFFGLTTIFRFQAVLLALTAGIFLFYLAAKNKITWNKLVSFALGGIIAFAFLLFLDIVENRAPLATPMAYWRMSYSDNIMAHHYGVYPWYNYFLIILTVFIPPFSLLLLNPLFKGMMKDKLSAYCFIIFITAHSFIGHKLERYVLPALPLFFILTLYGLQETWYKKLVRFAWKGFWILNCLLLPVVIFSRSQLNIIDAAQYLTASERPLLLYRIELWKQAYMTFKKPFPESHKNFSEILTKLQSTKHHQIDLLSLGKLTEQELRILQQNGFSCENKKEFQPSWQEKIVIYFNPESNARRNTSVLYLCQANQNK